MGQLVFNDGTAVGEGSGAFVIAEAGVNHNGNVDLALRLVDVAAEAGADAVKFQTFKSESLTSAQAPKASYQERDGQAGESQLEMLRRLELSEEGHRAVVERCRQRGILFLSTPFDLDSAEFLLELGVPIFKVGSGELTNLPFLSGLATLGKPTILSSGMAVLGEIEDALAAMAPLRDRVAVLHCVSCYPARPEQANLRAMETMRRAFGVPTGYSDHTLGITVPLAAVALGARIIEKHYTLDRNMAGPDHAASLEPAELRALVSGIRDVEAALGTGHKVPHPEEAEIAAVARRSVVAGRDLVAGATIGRDDLLIRRPGTGLPPASLPRLVGRRLARNVTQGSPITHSDLD